MTDQEIRDEVRAWLDANWDREKQQPKDAAMFGGKGWRERMFDGGWAEVTWPVEWYGRGYTNAQAKVVDKVFAEVGARSGEFRTNIFANTLLTAGTDELKRTLLPEFLKTGFFSCLLYSEPGAGSDLAAVRTRADRVEGGWRVTGQKVWTSGAAQADYGLLLARTDWDKPKHKGLSFFLMPMKQDGVDVRPLHQITDERHFNEVFIDGAFVPEANLLGPENEGWKILQTALAYERLIMGEGVGGRREGTTKALDVLAVARERGALSDPALRQKIAQALAYRQLNDLNLARAKAEMSQGTSSPIMSLGKLAMSRILHGDAAVMTAILGAESLLNGPDNKLADDVNHLAFKAYMTSIGGGSDQIQRNIISERVLGLPREMEVDRDLPFRESRAVRG